MTTQSSTLNGETDHHVRSTPQSHTEKPVLNFINVYNSRATFFDDSFIKKVKEGNRKALAALQRHPLPPTQMDLRKQFAECVNANIPDDRVFSMSDGKAFTMQELKQHVPLWALVAETALMESDPALADKLMSPVQWNAKSAFEVTFANAMNELKDLKKMKTPAATFDHYHKWVITPLKKAIAEVKSVAPPRNTLVGYGDRIRLWEAVSTAENLEAEFRKVLKGK